MDQDGDRWLTRAEVAERLRLPLPTVTTWGSRGGGPRYARIGRHARYLLSDVVAWEKEQLANR